MQSYMNDKQFSKIFENFKKWLIFGRYFNLVSSCHAKMINIFGKHSISAFTSCMI